MPKTPEQMKYFWQNLSAGWMTRKSDDEIDRYIRRSILNDWSDSKVELPKVIKPKPIPVDELQQLQGQVNFLTNKITELRAEKVKNTFSRPDYK